MWWLVLACNGDPAEKTPGPGTDPTGTPTGTILPGDDDDDDTPVTTPDTDVTFHRDVAPLLATSCARCHSGSGFGPGDFLDYTTASAWSEVMIDRIDAGEMPPPAADPDCHPYQDQEHFQADPALRDTLQAWVDAGLPEGVASDAPEPWAPASLPNADLVMQSAAPRVPEFEDGNEYRCFLLGTVDEETWITGVEFLNNSPAITHHAVLFLDNGGAENNVTDQATQSWHCGVFDLPGDIIHAWAPSGGALQFPPGAGVHIPAGGQLVLQMHYYEGGGAASADQPGYAFTTASSVSSELVYVGVGPSFFVIPAGDPSYTNTMEVPISYFTGFASLDVWGVFPHMHILGTGYDFHAVGATGEKCISRASEYDFSMQPTYWFDEPVTIGPQDTLSVSCTWDNSADNPLQVNDPPVAVTWGENTQNEMCYAFLYATLH